MEVLEPRAAYIHVPFCRHRCGYCDFAVIAGRDDLVDRFLDALAAELSWLGRPRLVETLYFGGGTPSHLLPDRLAKLCQLVRERHPLVEGGEWTVEANPESLTTDRLDVLADYGVTRISLGVQSFDDAKLRNLDRQHSGERAREAVARIQAAGMQVSLDLIFAAPEESLAAWQRDLNVAIELQPDHVSTYGLTFERGTAFAARLDRGQLCRLDEELERAMYAEAIDALSAAGFEHYEVSNFAQPGNRSRHNENYWSGGEYFAAGPGAARHVAGVRETNVRGVVEYIKTVLAGGSPVADREELPPSRKARERLVLGLRRLCGIDKRQFADVTGYAVDELAGAAIKRFAALKLLDDDDRSVRLTREGLFISDALWPELLDDCAS